mmetsp:Transcript_28578/g.54601  ORF Transcript_28578/g.54601 Transcript_28578/m.54601 type:complete len:250 (-) Transcript_28578:76-825(-)
MFTTQEHSSAAIIVATKIALGFCDVCASGARALLGIQAPEGGRKQVWALDYDPLKEICLHPSTDFSEQRPVQLVTLFDAANTPVCTLLVVLGGVPATHEAQFAHDVFEFLNRHAGEKSLQWVVVAAMRLSDGDHLAEVPVYHVPMNNSACSSPEWKSLASTTKVPDGMIAALMHCCRAREETASFLLVPGHLLLSVANAESEQVLQLTYQLGAAAVVALGCGVSEESIRGVHVKHLWYPDVHEAIPIYS